MNDVKLWTLIGAQVDEFRPIFSPGDNICSYYLINRNGNIFSRYSGQFLVPIITEKGYQVISLNTIDGSRIQRRIHRLVMTTFHYFPGCENMQVDHVYGDKQDNRDFNLEWVTGKENTNRAIQLGLKQSWKYENNPKAKITRDIALHAAEMAANGATDNEIMSLYPEISFYMLQDIIQGEIWDIPEELVNKIHNVRHPIIINEYDKHRICKWFQDNNINTIFATKYKGMKQDYINIAIKSLNLPNTDSVFRIVKRLFYRIQDNDITNLYVY